MNKERLSLLAKSIHIPKYDELPNMGLYLEQTTKYINQVLEPLGCVEITASMIRNYVKMGLIKNPVKKTYDANHIAHLLCITMLKVVMPLENIRKMFKLQEEVYTDAVAYNYFCLELENVISFCFGLSNSIKKIGETHSLEKEMLRSTIIAISHTIYLNACFRFVTAQEENKTETEDVK
ncbi:MAG: DUF1836 domain-containing protein [Ruminococcaceae bacterium]|nr:DUF1836 domain-containing protein [Oscillospiraceae bacterium]